MTLITFPNTQYPHLYNLGGKTSASLGSVRGKWDNGHEACCTALSILEILKKASATALTMELHKCGIVIQWLFHGEGWEGGGVYH